MLASVLILTRFSHACDLDFDEADLRRLVKKAALPKTDIMKKAIKSDYAFLAGLDTDLRKISDDAKAHRRKDLVNALLPAIA
jgi:hypothetical protein